MTDVECLNKALKLRQFVRADASNHPIRTIQLFCLEELGDRTVVKQIYGKITKKEEVTRVAQLTINTISLYMRRILVDNQEKYLSDRLAINFISSMDIRSYLQINGQKLIQCVFTPLKNEGIEKLHELVSEEEVERDRNRLKRIRMVVVNLPVGLIEFAASYNEDKNDDINELSHLLLNDGRWKKLNKVTTKEFQYMLKTALGKVTSQDFNVKLGIENFDKDSIIRFRTQCKNVKLRHIFYRLVSRDFFTKEKMFKYKMCDNNLCNRCGEVETYRHLLWDCIEAKKIWQLYNRFKAQGNFNNVEVKEYKDIFIVDNSSMLSKVKMRIIQEMIQIIRPTNWSLENLHDIYRGIDQIEKYNAFIAGEK